MILKKGDFHNQDVKNMQEYLTHLGYDTKGIDGHFGQDTQAALDAFAGGVIHEGYDNVIDDARAYWIATDFYESLLTENVHQQYPWMQEAFYNYLDQEIKGDSHCPEIIQIWRDAKLGGIKDDETPWCAGAVSAWLERAGFRSMRTAWARNYLEYGEKLLEPRWGCIVVFERGSGGHVGFVTGITECGTQIRVLGGNQGDCVNERMFPVSRVLGYRQPEGEELLPLPIVLGGQNSKTEA